jgi:acylphosphatase
MKRRVHIFISGHVQGVSFRAHMWKEANAHKVTGWVRNLKDRRVEAVLEGEDPGLEAMLMWCHKGPMAARVENVEVFGEAGIEKLVRFDVR